MSKLHVDFQEGFARDEVIVEIDGREVFHEENVHTDMRIGRAITRPGRAVYHEAEVPEGSHTITISLPRRNIRKDINVPPANKTYLGISLEGGKIIHIISDTPMGYA